MCIEVLVWGGYLHFFTLSFHLFPLLFGIHRVSFLGYSAFPSLHFFCLEYLSKQLKPSLAELQPVAGQEASQDGAQYFVQLPFLRTLIVVR